MDNSIQSRKAFVDHDHVALAALGGTVFRCHLAASPQLEFSESDVAESGEEAGAPDPTTQKQAQGSS